MVPSPGIRPFLPFALGDQKKKKRETEKRIVHGKNRKKDFQVDIKCHVYHLNRPASGNGDTGGGLGSSLTKDDGLFRDESRCGWFFRQKASGSAYPSHLLSATGRLLRVEKVVRPATARASAPARAGPARSQTPPGASRLCPRHRGPSGLFSAHGLSQSSTAPQNEV